MEVNPPKWVKAARYFASINQVFMLIDQIDCEDGWPSAWPSEKKAETT